MGMIDTMAAGQVRVNRHGNGIYHLIAYNEAVDEWELLWTTRTQQCKRLIADDWLQANTRPLWVQVAEELLIPAPPDAYLALPTKATVLGIRVEERCEVVLHLGGPGLESCDVKIALVRGYFDPEEWLTT